MKTKFVKILSLMLIVVLTAAALTTLASCDNKTPAATKTEAKTAETAEITITVEVTSADGSKKDYVITTTAANLYEAMNGENLVGGEDSAYGFYLKTVAGERADYDLDGAYWALYKGGEMMMVGMESQPIADGDHYEIIYTK